MAQTWMQRYSGYALELTKDTRNRAQAEVERMHREDRPVADIERAEARLASWDELLITYSKAKKREKESRNGLQNSQEFPVEVTAYILPEKEDPSAAAGFANSSRAGAYAQALVDSGDYCSVSIRSGDDVYFLERKPV
jgi:hypothetical protein